MKIKLNKTTTIRVIKNKSNKGWKQIGMFQNQAFVIYNDEEYSFQPRFEESTLKIDKIYSRKSDANVIDYNRSFELGKLKLNLIKFLLNRHRINHFFFNVKTVMRERKKMFQAFAIAFVVALGYLIVNLLTQNSLMEFMKNNVYIQSSLLFLAVIGIMKLYRPFSIIKGFSEDDAKRINEDMRQQHEWDKEAEERASF